MGYLVHGAVGDRLGRRRTIIGGWLLGGLASQATGRLERARALLELYLLRLPEQRRMRLAIEYLPEGATLADISAVLNGPEGPLSETWITRWTRE